MIQWRRINEGDKSEGGFEKTIADFSAWNPALLGSC